MNKYVFMKIIIFLILFIAVDCFIVVIVVELRGILSIEQEKNLTKQNRECIAHCFKTFGVINYKQCG